MNQHQQPSAVGEGCSISPVHIVLTEVRMGYCFLVISLALWILVFDTASQSAPCFTVSVEYGWSYSPGREANRQTKICYFDYVKKILTLARQNSCGKNHISWDAQD